MGSLALHGTIALLLVACTPVAEEEGEECRSFSLLQVSLLVGERRDEAAKAGVAAALLDACPAEIFDAHQRELLMSWSGRGRSPVISPADVLDDQWASVCPPDGLAQLQKLRPPVGERELRAYELCDWDRFGIVERHEIDTTTTLGTAWGVYPALLAAEVPQDLSRRLARVLILGEGPGATRLVEDCSTGKIRQIELPPMDSSRTTAWLILNFDYLEVAPRWGRNDEPWDANKMCVRHGDGAWELVGPGTRIQIPADVLRPQHWKLWGQHYYLRVIPGEELEFATTNDIWKVTRAHLRGPRFSVDRVIADVECVNESNCAAGFAPVSVGDRCSGSQKAGLDKACVPAAAMVIGSASGRATRRWPDPNRELTPPSPEDELAVDMPGVPMSTGVGYVVIARQPEERSFTMGFDASDRNGVWTNDVSATIIPGFGEIWTVWLDDHGDFQAEIHTRERTE